MKVMTNKRRSNATGERHDRTKWWFIKINEEIFVEKASGRAKSHGNELPHVVSIRASSTKQEMLKVRLKFTI